MRQHHVWELRPHVFCDGRRFFMEPYDREKFAELGMVAAPRQTVFPPDLLGSILKKHAKAPRTREIEVEHRNTHGV
jgi:hypothetical protein